MSSEGKEDLPVYSGGDDVFEGGASDEVPEGEHPLSRTWTLWETRAVQSKTDLDYLEKNKKIFSFSTVEGFWRYWNNYPKPGTCLSEGRETRKIMYEDDEYDLEAINVFRSGVQPAWEDPVNHGGCELRIRATIDNRGGRLDASWEELVLTVIGETMEEGEDVVGVRLVPKSRKGGRSVFRFELWLSTPDASEDLKQRFATVLDRPLKDVQLSLHSDLL